MAVRSRPQRPSALGRGARRLRATPVLVVVLWFVWGSAFLAAKLGLRVSSPEAFAALRGAAAMIGSAVLLALLPPRLSAGGWRAANARLHGYGALLGVTNIAGLFILMTAGIDRTGVGLSAVLLYTQPLMVAALARPALGERISGRQAAGLACGWAGVAAVVAGSLGRGELDWLGAALLLAGALSWAVGTLVFKRLPPDLPVWDLLFWQSVYGLLPLAAFAGIAGGGVQWGTLIAATALYAGVVATVGGFGLQFVLLRRGAASVVGSWIFAVPVVSAALGVIVLGERLHAGLVVGGAAVGLGIWLVSSRGGVSQPPESPGP